MADPNTGVRRIQTPMMIGDEHIPPGPVGSAVLPLTSAIIVLGSLSVNRPPSVSIDVD